MVANQEYIATVLHLQHQVKKQSLRREKPLHQYNDQFRQQLQHQYLRLLQQRISTSVAKETASVTLDASGTW